MGEIRILDTLVEVSGDAASDAGSTPAASTRGSHSSMPSRSVRSRFCRIPGLDRGKGRHHHCRLRSIV